MSFFSRLSDIVTCNLSEILRKSTDPARDIQQMISEMEQGLGGARRSVQSATSSEDRLRAEINSYRDQAEQLRRCAREELASGNEANARETLRHKMEVDDLVAGLEQQLAAASATRAQLQTTLRAIEARLADAHRKLCELASPSRPAPSGEPAPALAPSAGFAVDDSRASAIEADLDALRKELGLRM